MKKPKTVVLAEDATAELTLTMSPLKTDDPPLFAPVHPIPVPKKKRKSIANAQDKQVDRKKAEDHKKKAPKRATIMLTKERKKGKDGMTATQIVAAVLCRNASLRRSQLPCSLGYLACLYLVGQIT